MRHSLRLKILLLISACLLFSALEGAQVQAQTAPLEAERAAREEAKRKAAQATANKAQQISREGQFKAPPLRDATGRPYRDGNLTAAHKKLLAALPEDQLKFADFLKQSNTGLIRLIQQNDLDSRYTVSANDLQSTLPIRGGGAYYSFGKKSHSFGPWSDIYLQENVLFTQVANLSIGLFTALGDVPLETVSLQNPGVDFLLKMPIPTDVTEASLLVKRHDKGFREGEFAYRSAVQVAPNMTYILRSIGYRRPDFLMVIPGTSVTFSSANVYQGADVLIAFRVVRQEADGTVTILWKRLKKASAPQLKREKKEKLVNTNHQSPAK
jgi:hypothetical protein